MVFQIELNDEQGEHIELATDGSARLFGRSNYDDKNGCFNVSARQLEMLTIMLKARVDMIAAVKR